MNSYLAEKNWATVTRFSNAFKARFLTKILKFDAYVKCIKKC